MFKYLFFCLLCLIIIIPGVAQTGAQSQYNSYQRQHEQTVRAYSSPATPSPPPAPYKSSSSSNSSSSSSSGSYNSSQRTYGSSTNTTRPSSAAATEDDGDEDDYKPLTKAELAEMKREREEKARNAGYSSSYSTDRNTSETPARSYSSTPDEILRPTLLKMYDGTSGTYLEQKLPNGNTWQGQYVNDRPSNGRLQYKNGITFLGNFDSNGNRARGLQTHPDGSEYEGTFLSDGNLGRGTFRFTNGAVFTGEFKTNMLYRGEYAATGEDTKRGEFYPNGQLKVGKKRNKYGFYNENGKREGYAIMIGMRDPNGRPDEFISSDSGAPEATHMYLQDGVEHISLSSNGNYKSINLLRNPAGQEKYYAITQENKVVWFTYAEKQQAIDAAAIALQMIANGRTAYQEAVKWDPVLLKPMNAH